jgi:CubicO group peptidase (beta-lactamase class C family)
LDIPGASLGVLHGDTELYAGFGVTSLDNPLPVTSDTLFQCGSITKTFVGTTVMCLVDKGLIDLDKPVQQYLPEFRVQDGEASAKATMRTLLTHSGGWLGDHFNDFGFGDDALARIVAEMATLPQWTPIGAHWSYNNIGFAAAGRVIEVVTGQSFEDAVRTLVLEPLALKDSLFFPTEIMLRRFATGHNVYGDKHATAAPWELGRSNHPAGGVTTTVIDLLKYAACHIHAGKTSDGKHLLSKRAALAMREAQITSTSRFEQGLTWWLGTVLNKTRDQFIQHNGATNGFGAHLRIVPAQKFAITVLVNSDAGQALYEPISHLALQTFIGASLDKVSPIKIPAAQLKHYAGSYLAHLTEQELEIKNGVLVRTALSMGRFPTPSSPVHGDARSPETELAFYDKDRVFVASDGILGARGEFIRDQHNRITHLRWGGRTHRKRK